ncbi:hypothetical protein PRN20_03460 [Devosia sp. ZB163]|uniref:hypothetical protein n=1 Tax=Devosia sp. ZB163 TaxID=3025938 RepID=UPI00235F49D2|nr:hypothetical protein [Devosia sp. ZB163]MDC9822780.1 hypothetical protein [Devosia sp. ZB163]
MIEDPHYVGYSARHSFAEACDAVVMPYEIRDKFMGHEPDDATKGRDKKTGSRGRHVRHTYGTPIPSAEQMAWIDKLIFD